MGRIPVTEFLLYTTQGCHLCEQAEALLRDQYWFESTWSPAEISDDDALVESYGLRIPVVQCVSNGQELGWPFTQEELANWLASCKR